MKINKTRITVCILLVLFACGCALTKPNSNPVALVNEPAVQKKETIAQISPEAKAEETKVKEPGYEVLQPPVFQKTSPEKELPPREPLDTSHLALAKDPVMINVEKMPLSDFVIYALGETLKVTFVMDEKIMNSKQSVTLNMPQAMPAGRALDIAIGMFEKYGLCVEEKAGALYVLAKPSESKQPFDIKMGRDVQDSPADILQVVPLKHIRSSDIEPIIKDIYKSEVKIKPYGRENVLLFYGRAFDIKQVMYLIETFDVPTLQDKKLLLLRLTYWQPEEFTKQISKVLEGIGYTIAAFPKSPGPYFLPIKQLNAVLVVSPDDTTSQYILSWKERLDSPEAAGTEEKVYTYIPKYSKASDLVESLQNLYGISASSRSDTSQKGESTQQQTSRTGTNTSSQTRQISLPSGLKIAADDTKNIIMIMASPSVYRDLLTLLRTLDKPAKQVLIEATIAELTLSDDLQYGLEWYINNTLQGGAYTLGTSGNLGLSASGLAFNFISESKKVKGLISAFAIAGKTNILSTPRLMVIDNKEATIQVGEDVPTVTSQVTSTESTITSTNLLQSVQYRNTGVILRVKPTINTEGLLTLELSQEVSETGEKGVAGSPVILMRKINTTVVIAQGQTLLLGGLMKEKNTTGESKVPGLGDIPIIGNLFKATSKTKNKTELIILVTPTIISNVDDATRVTAEFRKELKWLK
ncbi:type II secretion system secretin GspD [Desulfobacterium sp. N47]|uniref:General secretion pathway protein D n=1 Tax=uncultured Desulfobacterium sp. TaxID=201089 RepID=E1YBG2_9BACT|nr:hypothetical protein N47_G32300 [uncultured Desulfobacterium sp.]